MRLTPPFPPAAALHMIDGWQAAGGRSPLVLLVLVVLLHPATHRLIGALFGKLTCSWNVGVLLLGFAPSAVSSAPGAARQQVSGCTAATCSAAGRMALLSGARAARSPWPHAEAARRPPRARLPRQLWCGPGMCARLVQVPGIEGPVVRLYALLHRLHSR